jgi:hypothetical protein
MTSSLIQEARSDRVTSNDTFYHLIHSVDVDHSVDLINDGVADAIPPEIYGRKAIIKNYSSSQISPFGLGDNDIVMWNGSKWEIYMDVSTSEMNNAVIYDKRTQRFYQYTPANGWSPIIDGKSVVDGGTY